jgi:hypothetical protein
VDSVAEIGKLPPYSTNFTSKQSVINNFGMLGLVMEPLNVVLSTKGGIGNEDNPTLWGKFLRNIGFRSRLGDSDASLEETCGSGSPDEGSGCWVSEGRRLLGEEVLTVVQLCE